MLILQHSRERKHAFNSARIVERALRHSRVLVGYTEELALSQLPIGPGAGLLYPGADARVLTDLRPAERPRQLVILDGTWHHAKTFFRDIGALRDLPRYRLEPQRPGRYRIRREPNAHSLSTLEATLQALQALEPETPGLDRLMVAFDRMVERQLAHANYSRNWRKRSGRRRRSHGLPAALVERLAHIIVAYGESAPRDGDNRVPRLPVYWVAERLVTEQRFVSMIRPAMALDDSFLDHLKLPRSAFEHAISLEEFRRCWDAFVGPADTIAVYNKGTVELLRNAEATWESAVVLKSVCANLDCKTYADLNALLAAKGLSPGPTHFAGRAGDRLANAIALVEYLRGLANRSGRYS